MWEFHTDDGILMDTYNFLGVTAACSNDTECCDTPCNEDSVCCIKDGSGMATIIIGLPITDVNSYMRILHILQKNRSKFHVEGSHEKLLQQYE